MSGVNIALLGAVAGFTIFLALPVGRVRSGPPRLTAALNAVAVGILLFLVWDVLAHAWVPVDAAIGDRRAAPALQYGLVLAVGLTAGLAGLAHYDRLAAARRAYGTRAQGPGTASVTELSRVRRSAAGEIALMVAVGIGLRNLAEGLAIGSSAANGGISFAALMIVGFGLHNLTEGLGIVAPLAAGGERPSWSRLGALGLIGGGPTVVGTLVGQNLASDTISVAVLGLAGGSILYVVVELLDIARRTASKEVTAWCVSLGILLGFATDAVVSAAGA